jgi:hypothetical protein
MNPMSTLAAPPPRIGAWCSRPSSERVAAAKRMGIDELHLMVHDDSTDRRAGPFEMDRDVRDSCKRIVDAGLELHLTAWAQPYIEYLCKACTNLLELVNDFRAKSVCWDAEEPWTRAIGGMSPEAAAGVINLYGTTMGVSGIGYASHELDPLIARADYVAPQVYVTASPGGLALDSIPSVLARWVKRAPKAQIVPALAGYDQRPGDMVDAWRAAGEPRRVLLWSMRHLEHRPNEVLRLRAAMEVS